MKKNFLCLLFIINLVTLSSVKAQSSQTAVILGTQVGFPFHDYKASVDFAAKAELSVLPKLKLIFSAGYSAFIPQDRNYNIINPVCDGCTVMLTHVSTPLYKFIPVKAGLRYYFLKYLYLNGDAGAAFKANYETNTSFIYGFGLGTLIPFNAHNSLDFGLNFESGYKTVDYNNAESQLGFNLAYRYQF